MLFPTWLKILARLWTLIFWLICIAIPLGAVFSNWESSQNGSLFLDSKILWVVRSTVWQASLSTLISGVGGLLLGVSLGHFINRRPNSRVLTFFAIPYGVPAAVVGVVWVIWLGRAGILARLGFFIDGLYCLNTIIFAHAFLNIPLVTLLVAQQMRYLPLEELEAARTLGANYFSQLKWIIWPQMRWAFASALAQVMTVCTMSFVIVLILGGGPPVETLETELYQRMRYGYSDFSGAGICAIWQILMTLVPWGLVLFCQFKQRQQIPQLVRPLSRQQPMKGRVSILLTVFYSMIGILFIFPYFAVINHQFFKFIFSSEGWSQVREPLYWSIQLAIFSSLIAVFTAVMALLSLQSFQNCKGIVGCLSFLLGLPSGISILVLGLGVWIAYGRWLDFFDGNGFSLIALQATLFFPIAFRILWPLVPGSPVTQLESAGLLGASRMEAFWYIEWPRYRGPIFTSLALVAGASLGEVGAVSLFYSEKLIPLPLLVSRWMQQYRFEDAQAVAGFLFLLSFALMICCAEAVHTICFITHK